MTVEDVLEFLEEHREHNVLRSGITLGSIRDYMGKCMDAKVDAKLEITALTARAEQAEAREKAAVADMHGYCKFCGGYDREEDEEPCNTCTNARTFDPDDVERTDNWEYRGQPQEGEWK